MSRRVLLLITDLEIGGTPTVVRELATRLHRPGCVEMSVACLAPAGPVSREIDSRGVRTFAFGATHPRHLPRAVSALVDLVRRERIDTVFSFLIHANTVAAIARPFLAETRFIQSIQTTQPTPRWHWRLQALVHHAADAVVVPSPSVAEMAQELSDVPESKLRVIPNAIDPADYPETFAPRPPAEPFRVVFVGRLDPIKRIPDLLGAIEQLHGLARLDIYGDGAERARLFREIDRLRINHLVTLHGAIHSPRPALQGADVLVLPSAAEGFGLVLIEAMAAGVPVVATDVPGIRDVVQHQRTGLLVPPASPGDIARAVETLHDEPRLRHRLAECAFAYVRERFAWGPVLGQYRELLRIAPECR